MKRPCSLTGLRVVEIAGRTSARVAGSLLASLGAEVTRVTIGEDVEPDPHPEFGASPKVTAAAWDSRKRLLLLSEEDASAELAVLVADASIVLSSGEAGGTGAFAAALRGVSFGGVHVHLSPFGLEGPYAGFKGVELTSASIAGLAVYVGDADRFPLVPPMMIGAHLAGATAVIAALGSLIGDAAQQRNIDIAEVDVLAGNPQVGLYSLSFFSGAIPRRAGRRRPNAYPYTQLPCQDGHVCLAFLGGHHWRELLVAMEWPEWTKDPRFQDRREMGDRWFEDVDALVSQWLGGHTRRELLDMAAQRGIPFGPLFTAADLPGHPQLANRALFDATSGGSRGATRTWLPVTVSEHSSAASGGSVERSARRSTQGPLSGLRVLDLGWVVSAPMVGQLLRDLGADVTKVESVTYLDPGRRGVPLIAEDVDKGDSGALPNAMPHFNNVNRGKRSLALDLRTASGREVLMRLAAESDIVLENMGAGSLERLGLVPAELLAQRPGQVLTRISMMGQSGPNAGVPGFAPQATSIAGMDVLCGYDAEPPIGMIGTNLGDVITAAYAAALTLATYLRPAASRSGVELDVSMVECSAMLLGPYFAEPERSGQVRAATGNRHAALFPHGILRCAGEDEWLSLAVRTTQEWAALCGLVADLTDYQHLASASARRAQSPAITAAIAAWTATRTSAEAFLTLQAAGVPAAPAWGIEELMFDEHLRARGAVVDLDHELIGQFPIYGTPMRADPGLARVRGRAPNLGEHTRAVLTELGLSLDEIEKFGDDGAFYGHEKNGSSAHD